MVPEGTVKIDFGCFRNTDTETITLPSSLKEIKEDSFKETNIVEIIIPKTVKSIGNYAFYECKNLTSVTLSEGLESIGE